MRAARRIVALAQVNQDTNIERNFTKIADMAAEAASRGAHMLCLPENCNFFGPGVFTAAQSIPGPYISQYQQLAKTHGLWISVGGFQETAENLPKKYHNSHVLISSQGDVKAVYRKLHLFDVSISDTSKYSESSAVEPGSAIIPPIATPIGQVGLSICYDVRFPELYRRLSLLGAEVLLVPAAFLDRTGAAHWEPLLRARAIENQCYVVAAAQEGRHSATRTSYGHSCVIDPWGVVLAQASEGEKVLYADIDLEYLKEVRAKLPSLQHRRSDLP